MKNYLKTNWVKMLISCLLTLAPILVGVISGIAFGGAWIVGADYVNLSLFLAFAVLYPDTRFLLFFFIPVKVKWLAIADAVIYGWAILSSLLALDFLNALIVTDELPRTVLYSLNPNDNQSIGTILGCFQDSTAVAKIQQGSAWWFNDHKPGMQEQMTSLATLGNLSGFVGMLTDSRSFLSYTRHEYFRRILCNMIGNWVENGEFPADFDTLSEIVKDISYYNAKRYFKFDI